MPRSVHNAFAALAAFVPFGTGASAPDDASREGTNVSRDDRGGGDDHDDFAFIAFSATFAGFVLGRADAAKARGASKDRTRSRPASPRDRVIFVGRGAER